MRAFWSASILASSLTLLFAGGAHAGPVEQLTQVVVHPSDAKRMVVRYFNGGDGAFVTTDGGKTWKLLCDSSLFTDPTIHGGPLVMTSSGTMFMGVFTGMWRDDGHACGWSSVSKYDELWVVGFALDPMDAGVVYAATSSGGKQNGLSRLEASGTWSDLGKKDDILITDVNVVPHGNGRRFYVGAVRGQIMQTDGGPDQSNYVIRMSDDDGATWTEHVYGAARGTLHVQGVDPTNPDRILVSIERPPDSGTAAQTADSVLVSSDQGKTFKPYLTLTEVGGVAFAPDGRIWIGDAGNPLDPTAPVGLYFAPSLDKPASELSKADYPVQCLTYQAATETLYACQRFTFGAVDAKDGSFTTSLDVRSVASFVDCSGVDMAAVCKTQLCNAYCGFGHFAQAPVCCAYDTFSCGPVAADNAVCPAKGGAGGGGAGGAGGSGTSGASGAPGAGGTGGANETAGAGGISGGSGAAGANGGGAAGKSSGGHDDGGCAVGRTPSGTGALAWCGLALAALTRRRRRH